MLWRGRAVGKLEKCPRHLDVVIFVRVTVAFDESQGKTKTDLTILTIRLEFVHSRAMRDRKDLPS